MQCPYLATDQIVAFHHAVSKKRTYTCILTWNFGRSPLLTAITPKSLDVFDTFTDLETYVWSLTETSFPCLISFCFNLFLQSNRRLKDLESESNAKITKSNQVGSVWACSLYCCPFCKNGSLVALRLVVLRHDDDGGGGCNGGCGDGCGGSCGGGWFWWL